MTRALIFLFVGLLAGVTAGAALAQVVVVAGARSPVESLSREQAEQLYLGRLRHLADGTAVTLVDLPPGPTRDLFYQALTGRNPAQTRAYWSRMVFTGRALPPKEARGIEEAISWIDANPSFVGYLPESEADERVRVLLRLP